MELKLEVVLSSSIKRKKPWPRFCWLGKEKESVFLLDDRRISEINMVSGRTKRKPPKLHPLMNSVVTMASSQNGMWLCGLLVSGELFLWNRDKDLLKTAAGVPEVVQMVTGNTTQLSLQVSGDGMRVLMLAVTGRVLLWECMDVRDLMGVRDGVIKGQWAQIQPLEDSLLPSEKDKEASQHTLFVKTEVMGDACLSAFVFTAAKKLIITFLKIQWEESHTREGSVGYSVQWATKTYPMSNLTPPCQPVKSRGALVPALSPDGSLLAIVLNQRQPQATQVLFVSVHNFVTTSSGLGGCGSKKLEIPSKYIRSYWVGSVSWSPSGLFLACVLKRGSLLMLPRLGSLLTLSSSGCNVDFGPAHFLPLHPLVTYRPPVSAGNKEASLSSSSLSVRDVLRQRFSVTWHPRLFYLIVSDGYMATVLRVMDKPSPALLLKTLLKDTCKDLEQASRALDKSQIHVRAWLESVSCLNLDISSEGFNPNVTQGPNMADFVVSAATEGSTLPLFLQDQGALGGTRELLEKMQTFFEDDSDVDGAPLGSHLEDRGHLEYASMFDTLHALDTNTDSRLVTSPDSEKDFVGAERRTSLIHRELAKIQRKLLAAWAFGLSLGNALENRSHLLRHILHCGVRYAALLRLHHKGENNSSFSSGLLNFLKHLLSFLPWDGAHSDGPCCLGLMVELSKQLICLRLSPGPDSIQSDLCQISSHCLSSVLLILQMVSESLDLSYSLQQRTFWSSREKESLPPFLWPSDAHHVPMLHNGCVEEFSLNHQTQPIPQRPSSRLLGAWQWVYTITQQYAEELKGFESCDGWDDELQEVAVIISQIQTVLQASGERLEEGLAPLSYPGEELFLSGSYTQSADTWRSQLCEESNKGSPRSVFIQTRLCLALLYSLLSEYRLREAQELGDHMASLILSEVGHQRRNIKCVTDTLPCPWLPLDLHIDAAYAVVQTLGRFMASYFTNQPLYILPPHHVSVLPPLHLPCAPSVGRLVPLCQEEATAAVRQQQLSEVWTVDYAQDLLLIGGLLPETVWLAYHLGDWKTAASVSLAYKSYCRDHFDFTRFRRRELHLPTDLEPESIFQVELERLLGNKSDVRELKDENEEKSFSDPLEGEDWDMLQISLQEILKASVMAGTNVLSSPLLSLLDTAKEMCSLLPALVPNGLYLPSPPLYCPQPSPNTQDPVGTLGQHVEVASRHKVSGILQRLLMLLKSAHCSHPAAQWYISHLKKARHVLYKIKKKYCYPSAAEEEKAFPEGLMKFVNRGGFFGKAHHKDAHLDAETVQVTGSFRELCALCWMLHVRDQLSISCRKYQSARLRVIEEQISDDSEVRSSCIDALSWARRLLPFSGFLNAEEILQDTLLSLISELPALSMVADTLVQAFPEEEESVRVPLREKYSSLLQSLRQCSVIEGDKEDVNELMMIVLQDKRRLRRKHLGRLKRHLAPPELHLWEKEEEEEDRGSKHSMAMLRQLSLGTTLSTSTLTDCGFPPLCSDGDTAENTAETVSPEIHTRTMSRGKKANKGRDGVHTKKAAVKIDTAIQEESHPGAAKDNKQPSPPTVGTWEFELEDEEYLNFLELFLSYMLEKDSPDGVESGGEPPLLKSFSSPLRERELHSLTFDVLTTIHRRQRDSSRKNGDLPVFRAGCCYKPVKQDATSERQTSSLWSEAPLSRTNLSVSSLPGLRSGGQKGLFGLRRQRSVLSNQSTKGVLFASQASPNRSAFLRRKQSESFTYGSSSVESVIELKQGLDPQLEAQFPELGRLLEWMVRWADRRVLMGHHGKKRKDKGGRADEGVVIRVKASTHAILTSLSLMESKFTSLLGSERFSAHIRIPETQWTVAPVLQPEVERQLEREGSVDTGYPGSANTPVTSLDHNMLPGEPSVSLTDEPEEHDFPRMPLPNNQEEITFEVEQRPSTSQLCLDDLDVTPEKEGKSSNSEREPSSVSNGRMSEHTPDASLQLADLDLDENTEDMSSSASLPSQVRSLQDPSDLEAQASPVQPEVEAHVELSGSPGMILPDIPVDPQSLQAQRSVAGAHAEASAAPNPPLPTENPQMRQRLGEDLYRLVQNINYMSLMEVLGASFSNLQLAQQGSTLAQSHVNSSHPFVPRPHSTNFIPQPNTSHVPTTTSVTPQTQAWVQNSENNNPQSSQPPVCIPEELPGKPNSGKNTPSCGLLHISSNLPSTSNGAGVNNQEMRPLSVQLLSPETKFDKSTTLIPSSQGLLSTSNGTHSVPVVPPSNQNLQSNPQPQFQGLKLLQLSRPPLPQQSASHHPQTTNSSTRTEKENRNFPSPKRQLSFSHTRDATPVMSQCNTQTSERTRGQELPLFPSAFPVHTPAPTQGLRLLRLMPAPHNNITFPNIPAPSSSRSASVITAPRGDVPIKLLHLDSGPKMMLPTAPPSAQRTRLMSMEELTKFVTARQSVHEAGLRLLKVNLPQENTQPTTSAFDLNSSKRQKRREERAERERKAEVTFRPNESIIPTQEQTNKPEKAEPAAAEEITMRKDEPTQPGCLDTILMGQRLLDKAFSTSAELHAFASTCKRPPECQDASTNTEKELVDKVVSASVTTQSPKLQSTAHLQFGYQHLSQDTEESPQRLEEDLDQNGRQFISVLDLEDKSIHQDLPSSLSSGPQNIPSTIPPLPTNAQLHALATSVLRSAAAAEPQPSTMIQADHWRATSPTDTAEESPSCSHTEPVRAPETVTPEDIQDPSDSAIFQAIKSQSTKPHSSSSVPPTVWFSSRLSELDDQLAALQSIADNMEKDFSNSRMLVNTIKKLPPDLASDVKTTQAVKKSVRLSVPLEAWMPMLGPLSESDHLIEDEEDYLEEDIMMHRDFHTQSRAPFHQPSTSSRDHMAGSSHLHAAISINDQQDEAFETTPVCVEENVGHTELSDTAEMLDESVRERYISRSELDWSHPLIAQLSSSEHEQQLSGWESQRLGRSEDERRELRIWMRRKQREQLAVYKKHRESLREREKRPFSSPQSAKSTNKMETNVWRTREEKEKFMLLEQYNQRTREALSLASEISVPPTLRTPSRTGVPTAPSATRSTSAPPLGNTYRVFGVSTDDKTSLKSEQVEAHSRPWTAETQIRLSEDHRRRLGLHRPVTFLPKDRMSQLTRRGMLTDTKSKTKPHISSQSEEQASGHQRGSGQSKSPQRGAAGGRGILRETRMDETAVLSTSEVDPELWGDGAIAGVSDMDWLDDLSETGSSLSKIDWAAIERMVAAADA